jgi:membrane-bound metal-dependent hydrolase YbcI (DUF457 family)
MAGLAHIGVGLAAKPFAPEVNVGWLILGNEVLDILWGGFYAVGLETAPGSTAPGAHPPWWDHSLLMAAVWSLLFGMLASWLGRRSRKRTHIGVIFGLMVFAHWVLDWITHPMTAFIPGDKGVPLAFGNSPLIGLGLYRSATAVLPTEAGCLIGGAAVYILWRMRNRKAQIAGEAD